MIFVLVISDITQYSTGLGHYCTTTCPGDNGQGCGGNRLVIVICHCIIHHVLQHWHPGHSQELPLLGGVSCSCQGWLYSAGGWPGCVIYHTDYYFNQYLIKWVKLNNIVFGTVDVFLYYKVGAEAPLTLIMPPPFGTQPIFLGGSSSSKSIKITIPGPNIITGTH